VIVIIGVMNTWFMFHQSSSLVVCEVDASLQEKLKKFRFRKETSNAAILSKFHKPVYVNSQVKSHLFI